MVRHDTRRIVQGRTGHQGTDEQPEVRAHRCRVRRGGIAPQELFSYRWHPYAIAQNVDFSKEQKTLVEFHLSDAPEGTMLRVIESGFDHVPAGRRAEAFLMNGKGWTAQVENIRRYVEK